MDFIHRTIDLLASDAAFCIATVIASDNKKISPGAKALILEDGTLECSIGNKTIDRRLSKTAGEVFSSRKNQTIEIQPGLLVYFDILFQKLQLVVCGAGHIAVPLARFARDAGFAVTVIDDREDFASPERFPGCEVAVRDFIPAIKNITFNRATSAVVITRGHEHDAECLEEILRHETGYVGLIGSRRRVGFVLEMLARLGTPQEKLDAVFTPIGLPIGAESPEEIALSIVAELVCVRRKGVQQALALRNAVKGLT